MSKCKYFVPIKYVLKNKKAEYYLWLFSIIVFGLLDVVFDIIRRSTETGKFTESLIESLKQAASNGSFYLISIVLIASTFGLMYTNFKKYQVIFGEADAGWIAVRTLFLVIIIAALHVSIAPLQSHGWRFYVVEGVVFLLTIIIASRLYSISLIEEKDQETLFAEQAKDKSKKQYEKANQAKTTKSGQKL